MSHCTVIGKIVFSQKFERKDVVELSYFLMQKAMDNRIGINLDCNLTRKAEYFYPIKNYIKEGCIPYEILDNPLTNECSDIFDDIWFGAKRLFEVRKSAGILRLQKFYNEIIRHEMISYITVRFFDEHSSDPEIKNKTDTYTDEIKAEELGLFIEDTPLDRDYTEFPDVRLKIVK